MLRCLFQVGALIVLLAAAVGCTPTSNNTSTAKISPAPSTTGETAKQDTAATNKTTAPGHIPGGT